MSFFIIQNLLVIIVQLVIFLILLFELFVKLLALYGIIIMTLRALWIMAVVGLLVPLHRIVRKTNTAKS